MPRRPTLYDREDTMSDTDTEEPEPTGREADGTTPDGLGASGRRLWDSIAPPAYDLRPDELRLLEDASRLADRIDDLEGALVGQPLLVQGSRPGMLVVNGLVG